MTRTRVTAFSEKSAMQMTMAMVIGEGHFARPCRTARFPFCIETEVDGARYLRSLGFKPSVMPASAVSAPATAAAGGLI